jgi:hypothetical protein
MQIQRDTINSKKHSRPAGAVRWSPRRAGPPGFWGSRGRRTELDRSAENNPPFSLIWYLARR